MTSSALEHAVQTCQNALAQLHGDDKIRFLLEISLISTVYDEEDETDRARLRYIGGSFRRGILLYGERAPLRWYERLIYSEGDSSRPTDAWRTTTKQVVEAMKALSKAECSFLYWRLNPYFDGKPLSRSELHILGGYADGSPPPVKAESLAPKKSSDPFSVHRDAMIDGLVRIETQRSQQMERQRTQNS